MAAMKTRLLWLWLWLWLAVAGLPVFALHAEVPPPSATPARIVVSGHTSTAVEIKTAKVGQEIPQTYAGTQIHNTPGFEFYVSQHYALKSNMGDDYSRHILEISELAYPHWVAMVGAEPPDPATRMYLTYAKNKKQLHDAMVSDVGMGPAGGFGGGFTCFANRSAYNYPSGTLIYHQSALIIHENLHLLNMVCNGTGGGEGMTYSGEQSVYDPVKRQLTVSCFDKAPVNNYTCEGLNALRKEFVPMREAAKRHWYGGGGVGTVYYQFFLTDPDRFLKWQIWRDEFFAGRVNDASNPALMESIFGPPDQLNAEWECWVKARRATFHHVDWGWEQEGNTLMAYGYPWNPKYWSQMDIHCAPGEQVAYEPLRMDYPAEPMPEIVGPVKRGGAEPAVGYVADLSGGGWVGLGLGVSDRSMCQVVIMGDKLVVEGRDLPMPRQEFPLTEEVKAAGRRAGKRYGVTIQIMTKALAVTVRAPMPGVAAPSKEGASSGAPKAMPQMTVSVPLDAALRERLVSGNMSLVAKDGRPKITPFFDDARRMGPDLTQPAPPNRWRFDGMDRLATLYKAAWRLKRNAPKSLVALQAEMLAAVDQAPDIQARAVLAYENRVLAVVQDVRTCAADPQSKALALGDLTGTAIFPGGVVQCDAADRVAVNFKLIAKLKEPVECALKVLVSPKPADELPQPQACALATYRPKSLGVSFRLPVSPEPARLTATVELNWRGQRVAIPFSQTIANTTLPRWAVIGPFPHPGGAAADVRQPVETEAIDLAKKYPGMGGQIGWRKVGRPADLPVLAEFLVDFSQLFGPQENAAAYALTWLDSDKAQDALLTLGSDDGAQVWLNDRQVHKKLVPRGYAAQSDRIPIHLNQGCNKLLVKITQANGPWRFGAHLLAPDGGFLAGVKYPEDR